MSVNFNIPNPAAKNNLRTLAKGFGLPLVQRAIIGNVEAEPADEPDGRSKLLLGAPVYGKVFIKSATYEVSDFNPDTLEYVTKDITLETNVDGGLQLDNCIIDVAQAKNIIKTDVVDYKGSVKEYISESDFQITIRGFVATKHPDLYPIDSTKLLEDYLKAPIALSIANAFLNDVFGINNIVVESYSLSQQQGLRNVQYFQINCLSDETFVILETEPNV
jgi:hypothetical protein